MEAFLGKEHVLFTDNYYTSPTLAKHFTDNITHLCGAIRTNRYNYSKDIINETLEKGDAVFYLNTDEAMIACKYWSAKDKASGQQKVVYMLLTCHQPLMVNIANRQEGKPVVLWDNTIYIWVVLTKLTSNYTVYIFLAKHINGIENLHWYLYRKQYWMHTKYCKNMWIERCYFSKVYARYDCSYFAIVTKVQ